MKINRTNFFSPAAIRRWGRALILTSAIVPAVALAAPPNGGKGADHVPDRLLVAPVADLPAAAWEAILNAEGLREEGRIPQIGVRLVRVPADRLDHVIAALSRNPRIEFAEKDYEAGLLLEPNDTSYADQWHLPKINAPAAWDSTNGRADQIIAIIDTGVRSNHTDLGGKVLPGYNFISNNTNAEDDNGHGTMVAGAAAAVGNNGKGVAGVAWENWILPVKALDSSGGGTHSTIAQAITFSADNGARVINLSLGSTAGSRTLLRAVDYAWKNNCLLVAAAGNTGDNTTIYPAAYDSVVGVSALNSNDQLPSWATYGDHVSLAAPGVSILSTHRNGSYASSSGSSFAAPLVAGSGGLVLAVNPALSNSEVRQILEATADDIGSATQHYGEGRLNADAAVTLAGGETKKDTTPPTITIVAPEDGSTVSGTVEVQVDSYDDVGVEKVELYINGKFHAQSSQQVVSFSWDTTSFADGATTLEARASDAAGNLRSSDPVGVTVKNESESDPTDVAPPEVAITSLRDGDQVSKMTHVQVDAQGEGRIVLIELYVNGALHGTAENTSSTKFNWNTNREANGEHKLQAFAHDEAGNVASSPLITVHK